MSKYLLAVDQGTTSCRAILFDFKGHKIKTAQEEFTQYFPKEGWVEHDANEIWLKQEKVILQVISDANISAKDITAIGITNQRETTVVWDRETGKPIHHAIVWQDRRTSQYCDSLRHAGHAQSIKQKTGLEIDAYFSGTKIRYILNEVKDAKESADLGQLAFGTIDSWLIYKMTNGSEHATDVSNASRTMLYNIKDLKWDEELLSLMEIPKSLLPEVRDSNAFFGNYIIDGFAIPIHGVAGDQQSALFGQQCTVKGMAKNTYGTGCFMVLNTGSDIVYSQNKLLSTIAWSINGKTVYALEGSVFIGGAIVQWLRDGLKMISHANEIEALALSENTNGGIVLVPALSGLGAPHWDSYARGMLIGLTRGTNRGHIARAALESIALQVDGLITAMSADMGTAVTELRVDGGAIANQTLMQWQADIGGINVIAPTEQETTALGAALLAGLGAGVYRDLDELSLIWQAHKTYIPNTERTDVPKIKRKWNKAIERSKQWIEDDED